jgi:hypothetical protein
LLSPASNEFGSGPRVLVYSFALVYILFLLKGPEQMVPYLMELVCTVIPVQCMLYAVAALRNDYDREKGDKATVGGKKDWTGGKSPVVLKAVIPPGNVPQRLWYCVFWAWTQ